ncbi:MAG: glycosyltransferase family 4 protein [Bryobacteraceae bacterium]
MSTKICFYNHTGHVSGAERVLANVLTGLGPEYQRVLIAPPSTGMKALSLQAGVRLEPIAEVSARFTSRPDKLLRYVKDLAKPISQLRLHIKREQPDLIHANSTRAGLIAYLSTIGLCVPVIWHIHDVLKRHPISTAIRFILASSKRNTALAVSHATAKKLCGKVLRLLPSRATVLVIHNGVRTLPLLPAKKIQQFKQSIGANSATLLIGIIGQVTPRKGQLELVRAFAQLLQDTPQARLLIVGSSMFNRDGDYLNMLKREVNRLGISEAVLFLGYRSDVSTILQGLDVLVLNSSSEPFSIVLLEALANATPVVAAGVDGVPELIIDNENGRLFPVRNEEAMLVAIRDLLRDRSKAKQLGFAGRTRVADHFSQELFLRKIDELYRRILPSRQGQPETPGAPGRLAEKHLAGQRASHPTA